MKPNFKHRFAVFFLRHHPNANKETNRMLDWIKTEAYPEYLYSQPNLSLANIPFFSCSASKETTLHLWSLNDLFLRTNFSLKDAELSTLLASSRFHWDVRFCMCHKELQCATWRVVRKPLFNDMSATKLSLNRTWHFCKIWTLLPTTFGIYLPSSAKKAKQVQQYHGLPKMINTAFQLTIRTVNWDE